jgi:hypothetical protein
MAKEIWQYVLFFLGIVLLFVAYQRYYNKKKLKEGFDDSSSTDTTSTDTSSSSTDSSTANGIAGNAQTYAATIKNAFTKNQDMLLISKYRTDYENIVLNLDDYVNSVMLKTALNVDTTNPGKSIEALNKLNETKSALNNVMKYIDSNH